MTIHLKETFINVSKGYRYSENTEPQEAFTGDTGKLFRSLQKEYGKCVSRVYINEGIPIGWVFQKNIQYEDAKNKRDKFVQEVWVSLYKVVKEADPSKPFSKPVYDYFVLGQDNKKGEN